MDYDKAACYLSGGVDTSSFARNGKSVSEGRRCFLRGI